MNLWKDYIGAWFQKAVPEMIWKKQYIPDVPVPMDPEGFTKERDKPMER